MKNTLLFITGTIVGTAVAVSAIYIIYTNINANKTEDIAVVPKQNLEIQIQGNSDKVTPEKIAQQQGNLPQVVDLPELKNIITLNYKSHIQSVVSSLNTVINNNNNVVVPIMQALPQKLQSGNWGNVFSDVKQVKVAIANDTTLIENALISLNELDQENKTTTKDKRIFSNTVDFINTSVDFANSLADYLASTDALLNGGVPTKEQLSDLNLKIANLSTKTEPFRKSGTNLFLIINELNSENKK